jgi:hypothetical protein
MNVQTGILTRGEPTKRFRAGKEPKYQFKPSNDPNQGFLKNPGTGEWLVVHYANVVAAERRIGHNGHPYTVWTFDVFFPKDARRSYYDFFEDMLPYAKKHNPMTEGTWHAETYGRQLYGSQIQVTKAYRNASRREIRDYGLK